MINKLALNREHILVSMISQLEQMQRRSSVAQGKIYEIDRQIVELNQQNHVYAQHRAKGFIDAAEYTAMSGALNKKIGVLRGNRKKLLAEDENDELIDNLKTLDTTLAGIELQTAINKDLFNDVIINIEAESNSIIRFRLTGGLEFTETIINKRRGKNI
jgi:methyl coenzyme M reductase subunit C-like uncharacterized protein (methanogenesis marker protein 7)